MAEDNNNNGSAPRKKGRGGARPGAGRPGHNTTLIAFRSPEELTRVINAQSSKTDFIKRCIERCVAEDEALKRLGDVMHVSKRQSAEVPFFNIGLVAGFPVPLDNNEKAQSLDLMSMLCPHTDDCYLIRVKGNSMIDANINDGDIVIVDRSNRLPSEHDVAVCEFNGEYTLKRFVMRGNQGWLVPANPDFPEICVTENDRFSVWGTVTFVIHRPTA